ncbi:hypothetical protein [Sphingobium chlorophenolicum]|uniref:hypothetical protein n=1 Tax=Sphingobium chlorophenolicum TaxID=46429 RepID=UPI000565B568|nr:hypothetical protein [Sphingobium chlorophenolicum]
MSGSSRDIKNLGGRPRTGVGTPVIVRLQPEQLAALDQWIAAQEQKYTRPAAIRFLIDLGIKGDEFSDWLAKGKLG